MDLILVLGKTLINVILVLAGNDHSRRVIRILHSIGAGGVDAAKLNKNGSVLTTSWNGSKAAKSTYVGYEEHFLLKRSFRCCCSLQDEVL